MNGKDHSFVAYVDECGDEGFSLSKGSSVWLALSAAVFKADNEREQVKCVDSARVELNKDPKRALHFRNLRHEQKLVYSQHVGASDFLATSVAVYKPHLSEIATFSQKGTLYNYASKLLLERVSWICADRFSNNLRPALSGNGSVKIVFSDRRAFCLGEFKKYLYALRSGCCSPCGINWKVIDPEAVSSAPHDALRGLQIGDVLASSLGAALMPHRVSQIAEHRYLLRHWKRYYRSREQRILSYGLKTYPSTMTQIGNAISEELQEMLGLITAQ
jgi:hypothetical protein